MMWHGVLGIIAATNISDIFSGIFSRMSALIGPTDILVTCPARRVSISVRIWALLVKNIRAFGDFSRISFNESKSLNRCTVYNHKCAL